MNKKSIVVRSAFVLAAAALSTLVFATLDLEVTGVDVSGTQISVTLHNPSQVAETAAVRVSVSEAGGGDETLQSAAVTISAGATQTVMLTAAHAIVGVDDGPEPITP